MSFIKGDNSAPLLLFPCTKSTLCSFAFFCNIRQWGWCMNKGSSGLNKLPIWTMAVSKSTGRLTVNIFHSLLVRFVRLSRRPSIWHCGVFTLSPFAGVCTAISSELWVLVPHFCFTFRSIGEFRGQVDFLCFHCPPYQFLFCPSYGSSRYRLTCRGNAAPGGIPPLRPPFPSFLVPNFTLTN